MGEPLRRAAFRQPADAVRSGLGLVPEDRKRDGLLLPQSVRVNATLSAVSTYARSGWLRSDEEGNAAARLRTRMEVNCRSIEQPVAELSGGNQQKVVLGRWLLRVCEVLLLDEPTRGVDAAARELIYSLLRELAGQGKALVVVSSELNELTSLCDRIVVLSAGRTVAEFNAGQWTPEKLTQAAFHGYRTSGTGGMDRV
jgi:ribose transport system ATP-binding protein